MDGELGKLTAVWSTAALSGCYCYAVSITTKPSTLRLLLILPVAAFFTAAPYSLLKYRHLSAATWSCLTGLGLSKLILFSFGTGPLCSAHLSLPQFVCTLLLQVKIRAGPTEGGPEPGRVELNKYGPRSWALLGVKVLGFWCVIEVYRFREVMPFWGLLGLYCCHVYLLLEMLWIVLGTVARGWFGLELDIHADEPYLSSSLQDFWGKRWNLSVSDALRQMIYNPIRILATPFIGKKTATLVGVFASFIVSGVMHEWMFAIMTYAHPTWEVTWFFVLQGTFLVIELMIKKTIGNKWKLHRVVSGVFTLGFVGLTASWLFFPPLLRNNVHERFFEEYAIFGSFLKNNLLMNQQTKRKR